MLRASSEATSQTVDLRSTTDRTVDPILGGGAALLNLVDATLIGGTSLAAARDAVVRELGSEALVDAAGVVGTFEMMNRIADGTGMPVGKGALLRTADLRDQLGLDRFRHEG